MYLPAPHLPLLAARQRLLLVVVAFLGSLLVAPPITPTGAAGGEVRRITLPIHPDRVDDVSWTDTWGAPRGGGRSHIGVDMMGSKMIPLVAVRSATVTWGRFDNGRGSILRLRDDDGWEYQYIHLNNDTPGTDDGSASCTQVFSAHLCNALDGDRFRSGTRVGEGDIVGYMGDGGNAEHTRAHLHFEIYRPTASGETAINPTPSVDAARERLLNGGGPVGPPPVAAPGHEGFADHLFYVMSGRRPTDEERAAFEADVANSSLWSAIATEVGEGPPAASVDRLYEAFFQRQPDAAGIAYWTATIGDGYRLEDIAEWFAMSDEFRIRYEGVGFGVFLDRLYSDVLTRTPDENGKDYWLGQFDRGEVNRGTIVVYFVESEELRQISRYRNELVALALIAGASIPTDAEVADWAGMRSTTSLPVAVAAFFAG